MKECSHRGCREFSIGVCRVVVGGSDREAHFTASFSFPLLLCIVREREREKKSLVQCMWKNINDVNSLERKTRRKKGSEIESI